MSLSAARDTQEHQQPNQDHGHCIICVPVARARIPTIIRRSTLSHNFELIILRRISSTPKSIDHFIYGLHECARLCCRKAGANFFRFTVILLLLLCVCECVRLVCVCIQTERVRYLVLRATSRLWFFMHCQFTYDSCIQNTTSIEVCSPSQSRTVLPIFNVTLQIGGMKKQLPSSPATNDHCKLYFLLFASFTGLLDMVLFMPMHR